MSNVLVISDLQAPFQHRKTIPFLLSVKKEFKCDKVVCIGDEIDFHAISKYPKNPDGLSAGNEAYEAIKFMKQLYKVFPNVKVCTSNHTIRPWKRAIECGIPELFMKSYKEAFEAPSGWLWHDEIIIDNVKYIHGEEYTGQQAHFKAAVQHQMSTVIGHIHAHAGIQYISNGSRIIFGMNVGSLIDTKQYAFSYGKKMAFKPIIGCGVVLNGKEAHFIPML